MARIRRPILAVKSERIIDNFKKRTLKRGQRSMTPTRNETKSVVQNVKLRERIIQFNTTTGLSRWLLKKRPQNQANKLTVVKPTSYSSLSNPTASLK